MMKDGIFIVLLINAYNIYNDFLKNELPSTNKWSSKSAD